MTQINAGSFSRLDVFETCKFRAKLQFVDRIPEPERPKLPEGQEYPDKRGSRIHDECEEYVLGEGIMTEGMMKFEAEFEKLRELQKEGKVVTEQMWCFDEDWNAFSPKVFWDPAIKFRIKTDATVFTSDTEATIIDYKTGKRYGNEVKHAEQLELYAIGAFLKHEQLQKVKSELWYLDQDELADLSLTRNEGLKLMKKWIERTNDMLGCEDFPPNPNIYNCRWCPYGPAKGGQCTVGVQ